MGKLKIKSPVALRKKRCKKGLSLYLDIYINGKRSYEFLGLYKYEKPNTQKEREHNRVVSVTAEAIRRKREEEVKEYKEVKHDSDISLIDYMHVSKSNERQIRRVAYNLKKCGFENVKLKDIDEEFLRNFENCLDVCNASKNNYVSAIVATLRKAMDNGIIQARAIRHKRLKVIEPEHVYLTIDEIQTMARDAKKDWQKAFVFACLTGLRRSDVASLTWGQVSKHGEFWRITFRQKKTKKQEYMDISEHARSLMGEQKESDAKVFVFNEVNVGVKLKKWGAELGINKRLHFHASRHTFAVMMLGLGAEIYTVSKLLGHSNLATTQIYADIVDAKKRAAISLIPNDILK